MQGSGPFHSYDVEKFLGRSSEIVAGLCGQVQCHGLSKFRALCGKEAAISTLKHLNI